MSEKSKICWLPAEPSSGGASMLRWWAFLEQEGRLREEFDWTCPLGRAPDISTLRPEGRWKKAFQKYAAYPVKVRAYPRADLYHLLDHSWAHLLDAVPRGVPRVATVHDMIPLRFPDRLTAAQLKRWRKVVGKIRNCECIVADSHATRLDVMELLDIDGSRVKVVPLGVDLTPRPVPPATMVTSRIQALREAKVDLVVGCLGSAIGRKNLGIIPPALKLLSARGVRLGVVRGGSPLPGPLREAFAELEAAGCFVDLGFLSDAQVDEFYGAIDVLVMPSLYEGFGLPVIEAMAAGVTVVCSNTTSLPEVAGDVAFLFDPLSPAALADGLEQCLSPDERISRGAQGRHRADSFPWSRTLEGYMEIYREFLP